MEASHGRRLVAFKDLRWHRPPLEMGFGDGETSTEQNRSTPSRISATPDRGARYRRAGRQVAAFEGRDVSLK